MIDAFFNQQPIFRPIAKPSFVDNFGRQAADGAPLFNGFSLPLDSEFYDWLSRGIGKFINGEFIAVEPLVEGVQSHTGGLGNLSQWSFNLLQYYKSVASFVSRLFSPSGPSAIFRLIVSIIVFSIKGQSRWARSHIVSKRHETVSPFFANRNTSTPVMRIGSIGFIEATRSHVYPGFVFTRFCKAVNTVHVSTPFSSEAAAALNVTTIEVANMDGLCFSAVAFTKPNPPRPLMMRITKGYQAAKSFSCNIRRKCHRNNYMWIKGRCQ